jgi:hypothetical protein
VRQRVLTGCLLAILVASLTACGGGVRSTLDPVAEAASKSSDAGGVKVSIEATFSAGGQSGGMTAYGVFDKDEGELVVDMSSLLQGTPQAGALGEMRMLYTKEDGHTIMYVAVPGFSTMLPGGKSWIKADLDQAAKLLGKDFSQTLGQSAQNPAEALELLRAVGQVEKAGSDVIDGTPVTLYHATIDLEKAATQKGVPEATVQRLRASGVNTLIPVDVWIGDDDGLIRKMQMAYETQAGGQSASAEITMTMSDWGTDVSVETPSDDEVFDATELAKQLGTS